MSAGSGGSTTGAGGPGGSNQAGTAQAGNNVPQAGANGAGANGAGAPSGGTTGVGGSAIGGTSSAGKGGTTGVAGQGTSGQGAGGGTPLVCNPSMQTGLIGWATQGGTVTGGGTAAATTATSASALQTALSGTAARVVRFSGAISVPNLTIDSNKTLEGVGATATINGAITIQDASNVIVRNLRINAASSDAGDDGIHIQTSNHIWVDHVELWDAPDGNMDITDGSDYVTVSWSKFRYTNNGSHRFCNLVGADDGDTQDSGKSRVTFHHNWWADGVSERMPRVRFGRVHVFNNYYSSQGNDHCVRAGFQANVRVENNYYDIIHTPHEIAEDNATGILTAAGNFYYLSLNTGGNPAMRGAAFAPPYPFQLETAECMKQIVMQGAGPH